MQPAHAFFDRLCLLPHRTAQLAMERTRHTWPAYMGPGQRNVLESRSLEVVVGRLSSTGSGMHATDIDSTDSGSYYGPTPTAGVQPEFEREEHSRIYIERGVEADVAR